MATAAYTAGYRPYAFGDFSGGLNLRDKADAVGDREAIDLLNVTFTERGAMRQRDGYADFTPADLPQRVDSLSPFYTVAGLRQLIAGCGTRLDALDTAGRDRRVTDRDGRRAVGVRALRRPAARVPLRRQRDRTRCSAGTAPRGRTGPRSPRSTAPPGQAMPRAGSIAVTASSRRAPRPARTPRTGWSRPRSATQTNAGPGGAQSSPSRVYFSNPGQPEIWETDGFVGAARARTQLRRPHPR